MKSSLRQSVLCVQQSIDPGLPGLLLEVVFRVDTSMSTQQLAERIERVVQRHTALRQRFYLRDGHYWIKQAPPEAQGYCRVQRGATGSVTLLPTTREPIGVESERLFHADIIEKEGGERYLVFRIHHAIADLWSVGLLIRDFGAGREAPDGDWPPASPSPVRIDRQFWRHLLVREVPLSLPMASRRSSHTARSKVLSCFVIERDRTAALQQLAAACAVTPYVIFLAAQTLTLARLGQSHRPSLAVTFHGRNRSNREQVGYFANTLSVPFEVGECDVSTFIRQTAARLDSVSQATLGAGYPELAQQMAEEGYQPAPPSSAVIFQQDMPGMPRGLAAALLGIGAVALGEMTLTAVEAPPSIGPFACALLLTQHDGRLHGRVEVDPAQHPGWLAQEMAGQFAQMIEAMVQQPYAMLATLQAALLPKQNAQPTSSATPAVETLIASFLQQATVFPERPAVITPQAMLSYAELASRTAIIAAALRHRGIQPGQAVAILLPRDISLIPTLLAVMACGGSYVPLSESNPAELNRTILGKARCRAIVTNGSGMAQYGETASCWLVENLLAGAEAPLEDLSTLQATAYTLFTSGSTGEPKGVAIAHANAANLLRWAARDYRAEELAQTLAVTPLTFDLSIFELFAPLTVGGCVRLVSSVLSLIDSMSMMNHATLLNTVPSAAEALLQHDAFGGSLRVLNLAGEPLSRDLYLRLQKKLPATRIVNLYGPTETTTYSTGAVITSQQTEITIGSPLYGSWVDVVDENMQPVGVAVPGELIIYGHGVAQGYVGDPQRTAAAFLPAPGGLCCYRTGDRVRWLPNGELDYLGRQDDQIKIRGFRVELGAVQAALNGMDEIRESVVMVAGNDQHRSIVAFIVLTESTADENTSHHIIKQGLLSLLPPYALPEKLFFLPMLPRNKHGKVDRHTLIKQSAYSGPVNNNARAMTDIEQRVADCWQQVLGGEIRLNDNFLDIGGHSLSLTQLTGLLRKEFNIHILLHDLWTRPTVEQQAALIIKLLNSSLTTAAPTPIPRVNRNSPHH